VREEFALHGAGRGAQITQINVRFVWRADGATRVALICKIGWLDAAETPTVRGEFVLSGGMVGMGASGWR
jgi:hypothetical protein